MKRIEKKELKVNMNITSIKTLGELKKTDYFSRSIQQELAHNLKERLQSGEKTFEGLIGYENTVIPDVERAILSGHNINLQKGGSTKSWN